MLRKMSVALFLLAFTGGLMFAGQASQAQQAAPEASAHGGRGMAAMSPENRLKMLTEKLNLTGDQQTKLKPILEDESTQLQAIHNDTSLAQPDRRAKMKKVHDASTDKINSVLTPEQQTKWKQMKEEMMEKHKDMKGQMEHQ